VPKSVADVFIVCLVLLHATAVGFLASGGRGRIVETLVVGIGCVAGYLAGWGTGRFAAPLVVAAFVLLEAHYGRLHHDHFWQEVFLAAGAGGATLAAAYLRLTVDTHAIRAGTVLHRLGGQHISDEIDTSLGLDARRGNTLAYELERARRHNHALSVLIIRPDDFDEIMLRFGQEAANTTLQTVASVIGRSLRATDIPVRERPFDFAVILPETSRQHARIVAERIRLAVCERRLEFGPGDVVDPTVAIGVAAFPQDATTNEAMTRALHRALQASVESGGNRTMLFSVPTDSPAGWGLTREQLAP
jgi:diguanylate cyclase (GGDEF)-like protein